MHLNYKIFFYLILFLYFRYQTQLGGKLRFSVDELELTKVHINLTKYITACAVGQLSLESNIQNLST